ncbi:hypothetical protein PR048_028420 [Dryococelus australis]|uniref:Uncharacterized protein n=1 Tax=Dryococelus australis TaxID=614101 RepID=A0ABQ9GAI3_9NEOP|nr:hypothetical protein PR048_028420 [Dryococelus australis]
MNGHRADTKQAIAGDINNLEDKPVAARAASHNKDFDSCCSIRVMRTLPPSRNSSPIYNKIQAAAWHQYKIITAPYHTTYFIHTAVSYNSPPDEAGLASFITQPYEQTVSSYLVCVYRQVEDVGKSAVTVPGVSLENNDIQAVGDLEKKVVELNSYCAQGLSFITDQENKTESSTIAASPKLEPENMLQRLLRRIQKMSLEEKESA